MSSKPFRYLRVVLGCATAAACLVAGAATASADEWNDKTILRFSEPMMVPGATLQPGSYVFKLMDLTSNRHAVQITTEDGSKVIALTQAVPMKRAEPTGDVVLKVNPTEGGSPPAIKAWFYPGSRYGHQFIYPDDQAKQIAQRTKTIMLSVDVPGSDLEKGTLHTYDANGTQAAWHEDAATMKEWEDWRTKRQASARVTSAESAEQGEKQQSSAPMIQSDSKGMRVKLDQLEDNPTKFIGKTISVDAEIEEVYGPRVFTIDEPNWGDLEGEILVFMPTGLAALVRDDDRVTITGTVKPFVRAEFEREWGWQPLDRDVEMDLSKKPVLVASRIVGGNNQRAMVIQIEPADGGAVGTSGTKNEPDLRDSRSELANAGAIVQGNADLVGRSVMLSGLEINRLTHEDGFFTKTTNGTLYVLPVESQGKGLKAGEKVSVEGVVLQMPGAMREKLRQTAGVSDLNSDIYVYATKVQR